MPTATKKSGTFVENMKLPIHRWFRYSAGFSAEWVQYEINSFHVKKDIEPIILEPFAGSGTTNLVADSLGFSSFGYEGHPFVARLAQAKQLWDTDISYFKKKCEEVLTYAQNNLTLPDFYESDSLLGKCYSSESFEKLFALRLAYENLRDLDPVWELVYLNITSILRVCSHVGTAQWQYILPNKAKSKVVDPFEAFNAKKELMANDMLYAQQEKWQNKSSIEFKDFRQPISLLKQANFVITSPPYPNNYDYADATRLEMTFWQEIKGWGDLKNVVRPTLMRSCSQHSASDKVNLELLLESDLLLPIKDEIYKVTKELSETRLTKGGKKTYHTMVAAYFYDLAKVWINLRKNLINNSEAIFVIGDSAPYGVYVPADEWLGKLAIASGFNDYSFRKLRDRNIKWDNRTHKVLLKEGILLVKG